jgi:HlyD family secretion protein
MKHHDLYADGARVAALLWAGALLGTGLASCSQDQQDAAKPVAAAASPFVASAKGQIDIEGGVIRLAAQREGVIEKVLVEEGDSVKPGQALVVLADEQPRRNAELARAEAQQAGAALPLLQARLTAAQRETRRLAPLAADDTVPRQELDTAGDQVRLINAEIRAAQAAVYTAQQRLKVAQYEIEQRVVRAPLAGTIVRRQARPGDGVSISTVTPLFLFAPESARIVRAEVEERFLSLVKPGQKAEVRLEADETQVFSANVLRLSRVVGNRAPSDDPNQRQDTRVVECVLSVDAAQLLIGQRVVVRFARGS